MGILEWENYYFLNVLQKQKTRSPVIKHHVHIINTQPDIVIIFPFSPLAD